MNPTHSKQKVTVERLRPHGPTNTQSFSKKIARNAQQFAGVIKNAGVDSLLTYPATRLARLPWQKLMLRFADECVLIGLGLIVILANVLISHASLAKHDNSLFAVGLSRHANTNVSLYTKLFSTTTTMTASSLIPEAQADEQLASIPTTEVAGATIANNDITTIDEEGLSASTLDSIKPLLSNQITVYETQGGDTLGTIAEKHDIDINTIKWSNNLTSDTIKPGWFLVIPSVKGVLVKADEDTTIAGIARKFKCPEERIISYNGLAGADSVEPGQYVMCPDGTVPAPPKPATPAPTAKRSVGVSYSSIPDIEGTVNSFVKGNCTWYVAKKMVITFHGNAKAWLRNGAAAGYRTGKIPMVGSAAVMYGGPYGHVAYVESVNANGTFNISEMNYEGLYKITHRTLSVDDVAGFVYPK